MTEPHAVAGLPMRAIRYHGKGRSREGFMVFRCLPNYIPYFGAACTLGFVALFGASFARPPAVRVIPTQVAA
jgi:hypothetical protein